jgi:hypothetical protein
MKLVKEITNKKGNKKVTIETQDGLFYCSVWVNRGETCIESGKEYKNIKSAEKFALKRMS